MSKWILSAFILVGTNVFADELVSLDEITDLPILTNVKVTVSIPGPMTAVQPTGSIHFSYSSCGKRNFTAEVLQESPVMIVQIVDESNADCQALARSRDYSVQISSDMDRKGAVSLLNPIKVEVGE